MFKNPGKKLRKLAKTVFWFLMIIHIVLGLLVMTGVLTTSYGIPLKGSLAIIAGILVILIGLFVSWISTIFLYAIGTAIDDIQVIKETLLNQYNEEINS